MITNSKEFKTLRKGNNSVNILVQSRVMVVTGSPFMIVKTCMKFLLNILIYLLYFIFITVDLELTFKTLVRNLYISERRATL
jgi:hypothetical protein